MVTRKGLLRDQTVGYMLTPSIRLIKFFAAHWSDRGDMVSTKARTSL